MEIDDFLARFLIGPLQEENAVDEQEGFMEALRGEVVSPPLPAELRKLEKEALYDTLKEFGPGVSNVMSLSTLLGGRAMADRMIDMRRRDEFTKGVSWAVPSQPVITQLCKWIGENNVLEVGCGKGLWTYLLRLEGVNVTVTDTKSQEAETGFVDDIEECEAKDATERHPECNVLFLCWPPYDRAMAAEALESFKGDRVIYIGEGNGGCTADDSFHAMLEEQFEDDDVIEIPQWWGIHDCCMLYKRK